MKQELLILPFDHRSSFTADILGLKGKPNKEEKEQIIELKEMIFEAFASVVKKEGGKSSFGILVDEEYGEKILEKARKMGVKVCLPVEKSGQELLKLEYPKDFKEHIEKFSPDFVKILIRYNPLEKKSKDQLKTLSELHYFCKKKGYKVIIELLVPPTEEDLVITKTKEAYDLTLRADRTMEAINEIKTTIDVDIWKLEGFQKKEWQRIIDATEEGDKIIFLGRGQDKKAVVKWLKDAASFEQVIGFAVGRTVFLSALKKYYDKKMTKEKAIAEIADNFQYFVDLWKKEKSK